MLITHVYVLYSSDWVYFSLFLLSLIIQFSLVFPFLSSLLWVHKNTWSDMMHHIYICVFLLKNSSWDLSSLASFLLILLSTQSIHEMSLHKTLHFKKHEFLFQMYTCSLLAIQMYHPCFQSYFRKRRVLISFTGRKE